MQLSLAGRILPSIPCSPWRLCSSSLIKVQREAYGQQPSTLAGSVMWCRAVSTTCSSEAGPPTQRGPGVPSNPTSPTRLTLLQADMDLMNANLRSVVGKRHPLLVQAAEQIFGAGGKKLRPALVFLVARATSELMQLS